MSVLDRLRSLRNTGPLLKMVWETSPPLSCVVVALRLTRAIIPVLLLLLAKLILDGAVRFVSHESGDISGIWKLVAIELILVVVSDSVTRLNTFCDSLLADRFTNAVSVRMIRHATTLDLERFEDSTFYDKLERARSQSTNRLTLLVSLLNMAQDGLSLGVLSAGLIVFSPWLVVLLLCSVIPSVIGETHFGSLAYSALYRWTPQRRKLEYLRFVGASVDSIKEVKIFGLGEYLAENYRTVSERIYDENWELAKRRVITGLFLSLGGTVIYYLGYIVVLSKVLAGAVSIGTFAFVIGTFARSRASMDRISADLSEASESAMSLTDLFEFFEMKPTIASSLSSCGLRSIKEGFEFRDVTFAYPRGGPVLKGVNLRFHRGEKLALVGENGAGKTTIVKLLTRLYEPTGGHIYLDGVDLRDYDLDDLRRHVTVIFQDFMQYDLTVRENIGFGSVRDLWDNQRLQSAAINARAFDIIERFPNRYDQILGNRFEGGLEISGGEWQKIALARAYMREAQLVVLDEPTANLDARTEHRLFQQFADLTHGRMALLISHRFSTVRMADRIIVLANGKVEEDGPHDTLMARRGRYAELFELQAAGYR